MDARSSARTGLPPAVLFTGVVLVAINLRPAAASVGPVLNRIQAEEGLSSFWAGALATLPVLCFGLLAPLAPVLARRVGLRTTIAVALITLLAGILIRLIPGVGFLFLGTAIAGAAIATGNVVIPVLVRRDFPHRTGTAMALYTASLIGFAALAAGVTVPIANAFGGGWRPGLAVWAIPAAIGAIAWVPALIWRESTPSVRSSPHRAENVRALLRKPLAWQVTMFFALQSGGFYATLAWLPSIFRSHGASETQAGWLLSVTMLVGILTALTLPGIAGRMRDQRLPMLVCCSMTAIGLLGIMIAPMSAPYLWAVILGLGQNGAFPLALMLIVLRGGTVAATEGLSTLAQSVGYGLAAIAPLAVGALHGATGSWTLPLALLVALVVPQIAFGLPACRNRRLSSAIEPSTPTAAAA